MGIKEGGRPTRLKECGRPAHQCPWEVKETSESPILSPSMG